MAKTVHFKGVENVLDMFDNRKVNAWGIFQDKTLLNKGWGRAALSEFLEMMANGSMNAIYTLKIFEDILSEDDMRKVKENTAADGSFNFILEDDPNYRDSLLNGTAQTYNNAKNKLFQRLEALEETNKKLTELLLNANEDDEPEETETIGTIFLDYLKNPHKLKELGEGLRGIFEEESAPALGKLPEPVKQTEIVEPATIETTMAEPTEDQLQRFQSAVDRLYRKDANLLQHLEKLADIAEQKPDDFKQITDLLDNPKKLSKLVSALKILG